MMTLLSITVEFYYTRRSE